MSIVIITDTSCLITLQNIGELDLLKKVFGQVYTTGIVAREFGSTLPEWLIIEEHKNINLYEDLLEDVDEGEASAITLAIEKKCDAIILDDKLARKIANELNLKIIGTIGVIIEAKRLGVITEVKPYLEKIQKTNFRISKEHIQNALKIANE